jgi:putative transposase
MNMINESSPQTSLDELRNFIDTTSDTRAQKRAIAVMMWFEGIKSEKIQSILNVSPSYVSRNKNIFIDFGIAALKTKYKGSEGYLSPEEHQAVVKILETKDHWKLKDVEKHIKEKYGVLFKSKQSYYDLLHEAKLSWKKTQKKNPKKDDALVAEKKKYMEDILEDNREEIEAEKLIVYMIDECHLIWGDACGYVWGKTNMRIEIPMTNEKERQTYFGAINYTSKQFFIQPYETGNGENTVSFVKYIQSLHPDARLLIFWDGASYHKYGLMRDYLEEVNEDLDKSKWLITCELFAPHAPEQNPVEDIWLNAKRFVRENFILCESFSKVKELFMSATSFKVFDFPKIHAYGEFNNGSILSPA